MKIGDFCSKLEARLAALPTSEKRMGAAVEAVRQAFRVQAEEVAILSLDPEREILCFLWPEKLQRSGLIPLSSGSSLAARTVRDNKAFLNNRFASAQHTAIFEQVRLDQASKKKSLPIQKIISAPLPGKGYTKGVIQVSRKGQDPASSGGDFSKNDLTVLVEIARVIARHL